MQTQERFIWSNGYVALNGGRATAKAKAYGGVWKMEAEGREKEEGPMIDLKVGIEQPNGPG